MSSHLEVDSNSLTPLPSPQPLVSSAHYTSPNSPSPESKTTPPSYFGDAESGSDSQQFETELPEAKPTAHTLQSKKKVFEGDILHDFSARIQHFYSIFRLNISNSAKHSVLEWVRTATWWFLRGRSQLENAVRTGSLNQVEEGKSHTSALTTDLKQAYIDLAKVCWISIEVIPHHIELDKVGNPGMESLAATIRAYGDEKLARLIDLHLALVENMRALAMSMKRNNKLPPQPFEIQGFDASIFLRYPPLAPKLPVLHASSDLNLLNDPPAISLCLGDTDSHFNYGQSFVEVALIPFAGDEGEFRIPCLLAILRPKSGWELTVIIRNQDGQMNFTIGSAPSQHGLTWHNVRWNIRLNAMVIDISGMFGLQIQLNQKDFKTVWNIYDYSQLVRKRLQSHNAELLKFQCNLKSFQNYPPRGETSGFPTKPVAGCHLRLFEKLMTHSGSAGEQMLHDGYRVMVVTPPSVKALSSISHEIGRQSPILFSFLRGEGGDPALLLKSSKSSRDPAMVLTFHKEVERESMFTVFNGTHLAAEDSSSHKLSLESFTVIDAEFQDTDISSESGFLRSLQWRNLQIVTPELARSNQVAISTSQRRNVRILMECEVGCSVDFMNLGNLPSVPKSIPSVNISKYLGDLQFSMSSELLDCIKVLRLPPQCLTFCLSDNAVTKEQSAHLRREIERLNSNRTIKAYRFHSLLELHLFQEFMTGFSVKFDGIAVTFTISRRRTVVPIHKRWEAHMARLQVLQREKTVQLVAFFNDFPHGSCMNFILKVTDVFESFSHSSGSCIRIVDAKFALPKVDAGPGRDFLCLDSLEYPSEHDDITLTFKTEDGKQLYTL